MPLYEVTVKIKGTAKNTVDAMNGCKRRLSDGAFIRPDYIKVVDAVQVEES
jgi:hypothetical protein